RCLPQDRVARAVQVTTAAVVGLVHVARGPSRAHAGPPRRTAALPLRERFATLLYRPADARYRPICVFVIEVNWQIRAALRKTSPSAISLNRRSSRPLAANRNMI